eukprot:574459-Pyramimonas_sp.AAC.1
MSVTSRNDDLALKLGYKLAALQLARRDVEVSSHNKAGAARRSTGANMTRELQITLSQTFPIMQ